MREQSHSRPGWWFCGIIVALALGVAALFELQHSGSHAQAPFVPARMVVHQAPAAAKKKAAAATAMSATLRHQLRLHRVVVAVLSPPAFPMRRPREGRQARARAAHAGFVVFDVRGEKTAELVAQKYPGTSDPAVLILRRPGTVIMALPGVQESQTVTQAVVDARR